MVLKKPGTFVLGFLYVILQKIKAAQRGGFYHIFYQSCA